MSHRREVRSRIVQKYGGSSVSSPERVREVARRVIAARRPNQDMVVVVSAMGKTTNRLLELARNVTPSPCRRELDVLLSSGERISASLLSMALKEEGVDAVSLSGSQAGIVTDDNHANATVLEVGPGRILQELSEGRVVVIAGYQGVNRHGEVTTLGRGGSDTSAVAFAAALDAEVCHICSDVDGVYTADPRIVPGARRLDEVSYEEMLAMARAGAHVLHPRAVETARRSGIVIEARASFRDQAGTRVHAASDSVPEGRATSVAGHRSVLRFVGEASAEGTERRDLLETIEDLDVLFENIGSECPELVVSTKNVPDPGAFAAALSERFGSVSVEEGFATASLVGLGLGGNRSAQQRARDVLERTGIAVPCQFASPHALTFVVSCDDAGDAQRALHREFVELEGLSRVESPYRVRREAIAG